MDALTRGFNDAYRRITDSESAYSAAASGLRAAVGEVPLRFDPIVQSLSDYRREVASVGDSELKSSANELFQSLNESFSIGNVTIATALPVSL